MASIRQRHVPKNVANAEDIAQEVVKVDIKIKSLIQDIRTCDSSLEDLERLNAAVRADLAHQKSLVEQLEATAADYGAGGERLAEQAQLYSQQLTGQRLQLRRANVTAQLNIERRETHQLLDRPRGADADEARRRRGKEQLSQMSTQMTDNMLAINRQLAEQVERSKETLDVLVNSSEKVTETHEELKNVGGVIGQSRRLLNKYGRRELTDTILFVMAFAFFFACVLYVIKKRLWGW